MKTKSLTISNADAQKYIKAMCATLNEVSERLDDDWEHFSFYGKQGEVVVEILNREKPNGGHDLEDFDYVRDEFEKMADFDTVAKKMQRIHRDLGQVLEHLATEYDKLEPKVRYHSTPIWANNRE